MENYTKQMQLNELLYVEHHSELPHQEFSLSCLHHNPTISINNHYSDFYSISIIFSYLL